MKLYVAYGSNLNKSQMALRCPGAVPAGSGYMNNWELIYRGSRTGSYASVRRVKGKKVPVGLWMINEKNEYVLDRYEGYPSFYHKENVFVTMSDGTRRKAMVYIMRPYASPGKPSRYYIEICRQGYRDFGLDEYYLDSSLTLNDKETELWYRKNHRSWFSF